MQWWRMISTSLMAKISPLTRLIFFNEFIKYQNLLFAMTSLGAKILMRKIGGFCAVAVGFLRPITLKFKQGQPITQGMKSTY
jgi:hypothetical protein